MSVRVTLSGCQAHNNCFTCPFDDCIVVSTYSADLGTPKVNNQMLRAHMRRWISEKAAEQFDKKSEHAAWMFANDYKMPEITAFLGVKTYDTARKRIAEGFALAERPAERFKGSQPPTGLLERPPCDHYPDPMDKQPPYGCLACLAGDS